jgi:hypothetical protein
MRGIAVQGCCNLIECWALKTISQRMFRRINQYADQFDIIGAAAGQSISLSPSFSSKCPFKFVPIWHACITSINIANDTSESDNVNDIFVNSYKMSELRSNAKASIPSHEALRQISI